MPQESPTTARHTICRPTTAELACSPEEEGGEPMQYRRLAIHVLTRALRDLSGPGASPADRESARLFLVGSPMLAHWCQLALLDPGLVALHVSKMTR
jgi:hypothetical protein